MISFYFDRITWMLAVSVLIISPKIVNWRHRVANMQNSLRRSINYTNL